MRVFKLYHRKQGNHIKVKIYESKGWNYTFARNGILIFDEESFNTFIKMFNSSDKLMKVIEENQDE